MTCVRLAYQVNYIAGEWASLTAHLRLRAALLLSLLQYTLTNDLCGHLKCYCSLHLRGTWVSLWFGGILGFLWDYSLKIQKIYQTQLMSTAGLVLRAQQAHHLWAQSPWGTFWARWGPCSQQDLSSCPQLWSVGTGRSGQRKLNLDSKISSGKMLREPAMGMRIKEAPAG